MRAVTVEPDARLAELAGRAVDWHDAARVPATTDADALAWARAVFEGAPLLMRGFLVGGWALLLLPGGPRSDDSRVLGWPVVAATATTAVLQRRSRWGIDATLLISTGTHADAGAGAVTFSSAMVFPRRRGRLLWFVVAPVHRWAVRFVLGRARPR